MARRLFKRGAHGFTLVELLIVVAIIGVLSTIGVPTFRRMVQKSKKSEAKVNLGGLYTAEAAFFAEYGGYGNNLDKVGFEVDGSNLMYTVGFPTTACASQGTALPAVGNPIGTNINTLYPEYYSTYNTLAAGLTDAKSSVSGNTLLAVCAAAGSASARLTGTETVNVYNSVGTADSDAFVATASGVIAPGINKATPAVTDIDVWRINSKRVLLNTQDGVR